MQPTKLEEYYKVYDNCLETYAQLASVPEERWTSEAKQLKIIVDEKFHNTKLVMATLDPWFFILNYGYTRDEKDVENPFKPFIGKHQQPEDYEYLKDVVRLWVQYPLIIVPKSRQLMITWIFCHLYLWDACMHGGRKNGMQTKNELAAKELIDRVEIIIKHLPQGLKPRYKRTEDPLKIKILDTGSEIWGLGEGPDVGRSYTFSNYFIDEAWTQDDLEETYLAARPATVRLAMVCSMPKSLNKSSVFFTNLADDEYGVENVSDNVKQKKLPGYLVDVRQNRNGFVRAGVFFWHVPHRWLIKEENGKINRKWVTTEEWAKEESVGYSDLAWRREQCGESTGALGARVFEQDLMATVRKDITPPLAVGKLFIDGDGEVKFINDSTGLLKVFEWPIGEKRKENDKTSQLAGQYVCGADAGAGLSTTGDYSVAVIANKKTGRIAALWKGRRKPITFAHELYMLLKWYNNAFIVPEANSYGMSAIDELRMGDDGKRINPYDNIYRPKTQDWKESQTKYGFYTGWQNKWTLIEQFAHAVRDRRMIITAKEIADEMEQYIMFEDESMGAAKGKDDCVSATALLYQGLKDAPYIENVVADDNEDELDWPFKEKHTAKKYCDVTGY